MFTGIIQEIGTVASVRSTGGGVRLSVSAPATAAAVKVNDSVAVSGACQTVIECGGSSFAVEAVEETVRKTNLGEMRPGREVNLELPLRLQDPIGGHLVAGHVDCVGSVLGITHQASSWLMEIGFPGEFRRFLIPVGSIAVDGVSLTVARLAEGSFVVSVIPHTLEKTTLARLGRGDRVNLEFDLIGKYVQAMLEGRRGGEGVTMEKLREWGYGT